MPDPRPRDSYNSPRKHTPGSSADFNPKAVTMAAQNPPRRKKLPTGPFIDSITDNYTGGLPLEQHLKRQAEIQMSKRSVRVLKASRILVLMSRILLVLIGVALVALMATFKGIDTIQAWIMRISPGVAALHSLYSVYHYCHGPNARTPDSSAYYALFTAAVDCCALPFFALISFWTFQEHLIMNDPGRTDIWDSSFTNGNPDMTSLLVFISFVLAASGGGLTLFTLFLGIYIAVTFRRISKLPPDLNPLDKDFYTSMKAKADPNRFSKSSVVSTSTVDSFLTKPQQSVPFLETRTKNGSLQWEYSRPTEQQEEPIPAPFKFDKFDRRSSVDFTDGDLGSVRPSGEDNKENVGAFEPVRETKRASTARFATELGPQPNKNGYIMARQNEDTAAWWGREAENQLQRERRQSTQSHTYQSPRKSTQASSNPNRNTFGGVPPLQSSKNSIYSTTTTSTTPSARSNNTFAQSPIRNSNGPQFNVPQISPSRHQANSSKGSVYDIYTTPTASPTRMSQPSPQRGPIPIQQLNFDNRPQHSRRNTASSINQNQYDLPLPARIPLNRATPPTTPYRGQEQPLLSPQGSNSNINPMNSYNPSARSASPPPAPPPKAASSSSSKPSTPKKSSSKRNTPQKQSSFSVKNVMSTSQPSTPSKNPLVNGQTTTPKSVRAIIENANRFAKQAATSPSVSPKKKAYGEVGLSSSSSRGKKRAGEEKQREGKDVRVISTGTDAKNLEVKGASGWRMRNVSGSQVV